jgi:hypothetical protein
MKYAISTSHGVKKIVKQIFEFQYFFSSGTSAFSVHKIYKSNSLFFTKTNSQ